MKIVLVTWDDAHGGGDTWEPITSHRKLKARRIVSAGVCVQSDKHGVTLALSYDRPRKQIGSYIFIPRRCVVSETVVS